MSKTQNSTFKLDSFIITESQIFRKPVGKKMKFDLHIIPSGIIHEKSSVFELVLNVSVSEKSERFKVNLEAHGLFSFKNVSDKIIISDMFFKNAPAIIFPYIRAYVTSLTALSGMEAIILPVVSMWGMKEELQKNTVTDQE